jgi:hypothetical protein
VATGMDPFKTLKSGRFVFIEIWDHIQPYMQRLTPEEVKIHIHKDELLFLEFESAHYCRSLSISRICKHLSFCMKRVISHIFKHNYSSDLSLSTLYNSGGGQMERSARLQARVVICECRPDNTQNKHQVMNLQKIGLTTEKTRTETNIGR